MKAYSGLVLAGALVGWTLGAAPLHGAQRGTAPAGAVKIKVLKNNVNLRAKPMPTAEVVGQVAANDLLIAKTMDSQWAEIVPPTNIDLWVLGDYVKEGVIQCRQKVNVRSGPGINFAIVGQLVSGDKVTARGTVNEWVKIVPPAGCSLWVVRPLVELVVDKPAKSEPAKVEPAKAAPVKVEPAEAGPAKKVGEQAEAQPVQEKAKAAAPGRPGETGALAGAASSVPPEQAAVTAAPPPGLDLIPSLGQGQWKQYDGTLRSRGVFFRTPSRYRLVSYDQEGKGTTVCYVKGNNDQLSTLIDRPMIVSGREYWVQKQNYPVLIPERIVLK